jgi:hypothetical protein
MKTKVTLIALVISLLCVAGFFVKYQKVAAKFWTLENSKPNKSFEEYSQMTNLKERIVALKEETPKNKSILWRQNLIFKADRMNLNQEQKAWVKEEYDFLNENFFATAGGDESEFIKTDLGQSYDRLMKQRSEIFSRDESKKFCVIFGDESTLINSEQEYNESESPFYCNCTASWCPQCPEDFVCENENCLTVSDNCGCFAIWNCRKRCTLDYP